MTALKMDKGKISGKTLIILFLLAIVIVIIITPRELIELPSIIGAATTVVRIQMHLPPAFNHNLTDQTIYESQEFIYDINCSNAYEFDDTPITYYDNFSKFDISLGTGIINWTPLQENIGNYSVKITCSNGEFNVSANFSITVLDMNHTPILSSIGPQIAIHGEPFTLYLSASDADYDNLTFFSSSSLFGISTINNSGSGAIGFINFTPLLSHAGNHTINISVTDGYLSDSEIILLTIVRGAYCGDLSCGNGESCSDCQEDCGSCPSPPAAQVQEREAARYPQVQAYLSCQEKWECSSWSVCLLVGTQNRKCADVNKCGTTEEKPSEMQECRYIATCFDEIQNGYEEGIDCGGPCEPCITPNCFDGIQNQNEAEIDCGGPCEPCKEKKYVKVPFIERPWITEKLKRQFPWLFLLVTALLVLTTISGDRVYIKKISKKDFNEYIKKRREYRKIRKRLYEFVANLSAISVIISLYIYWFSTDIDGLKKYIFIPAILILFVPLMVSLILRHYAYYEFKKKKKEELLIQTHKEQVRKLMIEQDKVLNGFEAKIKSKIYEFVKENRFDEFKEFYSDIRPIYGELVTLYKSRETKLSLLSDDKDVKEKIEGLIADKAMISAGKEYPEFRLVLNSLKKLYNGKKGEVFIIEENLLTAIKETSMPHILTIIKSSKELTRIYNVLVELHNFYDKKRSGLEEKEERISEEEREFCKKASKMINNSSVSVEIKNNSEMVSIYNGFIELYDHYKRKQELYNRMKQLEREKQAETQA